MGPWWNRAALSSVWLGSPAILIATVCHWFQSAAVKRSSSGVAARPGCRCADSAAVKRSSSGVGCTSGLSLRGFGSVSLQVVVPCRHSDFRRNPPNPHRKNPVHPCKKRTPTTRIATLPRPPALPNTQAAAGRLAPVLRETRPSPINSQILPILSIPVKNSYSNPP